MAQWEIKNKTFLVTGGASGLGAEYAKAFLSEGAKYVVILDIAEELGKATTEKLNKQYGNKVSFIKCDCSKENDIVKAFNEVVALVKQIDVIVNNAGIMNDNPKVWRLASDVNWQGVVSFTMKGLDHMRKDDGGAGGTIINIASTAALTAFECLPVYKGSKSAVLNFSQCIAIEPFFKNTGIRVLTFCPGGTATPLTQNLEVKTYDLKMGPEFARIVENEGGPVIQKVESCIKAMVDMFKVAAPRTIWVSTNDKPVQDLTELIDYHYKEIEKVVEGI
ncbi:15-hydroxyprostaglandin dehydrogenase [NAD(+)]-like [Trichoplusia ni]|uniref:15-hydroxyprostaglandin dehydrogenase [NAD(+)] n=1 Tax=Trichoplusia ni TaxID=7111 RepID=A0A7E5WK98_TRINI|nr:15-hydroxyprostaglandin dehydrogenase [NAD(+)]-like [Trichoplusia ni]